MKVVFRCAAIAAVVGASHLALAQSPAPTAAEVKKAADEFSQGKESYREGDYLEAAEHFEAADDNAPSVNALRAAMTSRDKGGQLDRAATLAALALERHPDDAKLGEEAREILEKADAKLHRARVTCDVPCGLVVGTSLVHGRPATERLLYLEPGSHEVRASWGEGESKSESVAAEAGSSTDLVFERPVGSTPEADPEDVGAAAPAEERAVDDFGETYFDEKDEPVAEKKDRRGLPPAVFAVGLVATAGLGGVTIWSGIDTKNNPGKEAVRNDPTCQIYGPRCPLYQEGEDKELRTNILIGATAGVGVITIVIGAAATDWSKKGDEKAGRSRVVGRRTLEPWLGVGQGAMVGARGRF